ncbi:MAG: RNA polymerase sigma factor [Bacteroidota bacterium]
MLKQQANHIEDLINRCLKNEQAAYYEVYENYHHAMYNVSYRILHDSMEAEDVMQESFINAFQKLKTFRKQSKYGKNVIPFGSWLKRIVVNNSINHLRKNKKIITTDLEIVRDSVDDSVNPDFNRHKVELVLKAIENLKPNYKLALNLHLIEGYDYEEVGEIMQISYQNSRTTISRAKQSLRKIINRKDEQKQI